MDIETKKTELEILRSRLQSMIDEGRPSYERVPVEKRIRELEQEIASIEKKEPGFTDGHALLIGVGRYKRSHLSVPVTANDAQELGDILKDPGLCAYPEEQVVVLTNENASKKRILAELDALKDRVQQSDNPTVLIFFSGHGWQQDGYYFLPYETETFFDDGRIKVRLDTALANEDFLSRVRPIPAQRLVVLFDTCFAGAAGTALSPEIEQTPEFAPIPLGLYDRLLEGSGRVIISSSKADEKSWIKMGAKNSLFSTHLLSAFRGQGSQKDDKTINILDVFNYLSKTVPDDAQTIGVVQTPVLKVYDLTLNFSVALRGGKSLSVNVSVGSGAQVTQTTKTDRSSKQDLVTALLECSTMSDRDIREAVVRELPNHIRSRIHRSSVDHVDVNNIVTRCLDFPGGIEDLIKVVRSFEGNSTPMRKVDEVMSRPV